jgi:DNA-binding MarR family transcriptional regulator
MFPGEPGMPMPTGPKPIVEQSLCSAAAMRKASRRLTQLYDRALERSGLRSTQYTLLAEVDRRSMVPPSMAELAEALVMDRSALGHNLWPLERDGFIAFQAGDRDRRRRHVVMTSKGKANFDSARALWRTAQERFDSVFGASAAEALRGILIGIAYDERLATLED